VRKATVGKRLAEHGDDTLPVIVGRPEIAGRGARGHVRTIPCSGSADFCATTNGSGLPLAGGRCRSGYLLENYRAGVGAVDAVPDGDLSPLVPEMLSAGAV
jgi:hypothetical protein